MQFNFPLNLNYFYFYIINFNIKIFKISLVFLIVINKFFQKYYIKSENFNF